MLVLAFVCATGASQQAPSQEKNRPPASGEAGLDPRVCRMDSAPRFDWTLPPDRPPVLFATTETLGRLKANVARNRDPWKSAWQEVLKASEQGLAERPRPYSGDDFVEMRFAALEQFTSASAMALRWQVTGEQPYADKAREILLAWANSRPMIGSQIPVIGPGDARLGGKGWGNQPDTGFNFAVTATAFANAYTTLYPALKPEDVRAVEPWLRYMAGEIQKSHRLWLKHNCFSHQYFNNHLSVHNMGLAAIGFALRDGQLVRTAFEGPERGYFDMVCGAILTPEKTDAQFYLGDKKRDTLAGEIYDRYRVQTVRNGKGFGLAYSFLHLEMLTYTAEMAWNNGFDVYSFTGPHGESLQLAYRHLAPYLITMNPAHYSSYHADDLLQPERVGIYEIAARRLGPESAFHDVLRIRPRAVHDSDDLLGYTSVLLYGEPLPE